MNKKPVSYLQTDPRWKNKDYSAKGESTTIGASGCGPTAAAMLIETLTGKTFTPEDACKWSLQHGYKAVKQGTYYSYFVPQFAYFGIHCYQLSWENTYHKPNSSVHDKALALLKQGYYLIALMKKGNWTSSGHFVVIWWADGKVYINDPASTKATRVEGNMNTFRNEAAYYWVIDAREYNKSTGKEDDDEVVTYKTLKDVPSWYRPSIQKVVDKGALKGDQNGVLNVSEDLCRALTVLDRLGKLD